MSTGSKTAVARRRYRSPLRERQAKDTRTLIVEATRRLFRSVGYQGTSLEAIASEAGVSPKTVEARFGSKRGLIAALVDPHATENRNSTTLAIIRGSPSPKRRLAAVAKLSRQTYETWSPEFELLTGARVPVPELAAIAEQIGKRRRGNQSYLIAFLVSSGTLKRGLDAKAAADELWALTGYEMYRIFVIECGWSGLRFERWLSSTLADRLLERESNLS